MSERPAPPRSESELLARAESLAGLCLGQLATRLGVETPLDARRGKGFAGSLLELALGADAGSRPEPDFVALGIELKTIPVDRRGQPGESTYLTTAPLRGRAGLRWEDSVVYRKLSKVLWMPIEHDPELTLATRRIGWPVLWTPDASELTQLQADWEELMALFTTGDLPALDARLGKFLQIRPKGANGKALTRGHDDSGAPQASLPRGFYLRPAFTRQVLARHAEADTESLRAAPGQVAS